MSSGGRLSHSVWAKGYKKRKQEQKTLALCTVCQKKLNNTSSSRLTMHRNICKYLSKSNSNAAKINVKEQSTSKTLVVKKKTQVISRKRSRIIRDTSESDTDYSDNDKDNNTSLTNSNEDMLLSDLDPNVVTISGVSDGEEQEMITFDEVDLDEGQDISLNYSSSRPSTSASSLTSFMDKMTIQDVNKTNELLGTFFFGCNIPFSVVDSTHFRNFVHHLRPSYPIPSRKALSGKLLDDVYNKFTENIKFEADSIMLIDGWKNENSNTKNVTVLLHSASGKAVFLNNWDLSEEKESGEKLAEIIEFAKKQAYDMYQTKIFAVISDNAANMMKMGRLTDILHLTCNSHTGQLLAKDILPSTLATQVTSILKQFNGPDMEAKILKLGGSKIILPCETRWCSNRDSFVCFLNNLPHIKRVISENPQKSIPPNITALIFDQQFVTSVTEAVSLLDPICKLINKCQSSTASIACAAEAWLDIQLPEDAEQSLEKRRKYALKIPLLVANYLHPIYRGRKLSDGQVDEVNSYLLENLDASGLEDLVKFTSNEGIFKILNEKDGLKPRVYWELASKKCQNLGNLAKKLLSIPASSAQVERIFSNWSYVHNKLRNRLGAEKSKKLVKVYYSLKMMDINSDEY